MMDCLRPFTITTMCSILLAVLVLLVVPADKFSSAAQGGKPAKRVKAGVVTDQSLLATFRDRAEEHLSLSLLYLGYADYFDRADVALPGFRDYFSKLASTEQAMGQKLFAYVNKRGGYVYLERMHFRRWCNRMTNTRKLYDRQWKSFHPHVQKPACICRHVVKSKHECKDQLSFAQGLHAMTDVYLAENYMYKKLEELHSKASLDPAGRHLVEDEFLVYRVDAIKAVNSTITELLRFKKENKYSVGEYLIDSEIGK